MKTNLAQLEQAEMDKVNVDLAAAGVAFKERYNMPVVAEAVEREQPEHLRAWFRERLIAHRLASVSLSRLLTNPKLNKNYITLHFLTCRRLHYKAILNLCFLEWL